MEYDIKTLQGLTDLTKNWQYHRERFFKFACESGDERWQREDFRQHMYFEYIKNDNPITCRLYSLDEKNIKTLIKFINEIYMDGLVSRTIQID